MRDYYAEFISGGISWDTPENAPPELTEAPSVSYVSSVPGNTGKYEPMLEGAPSKQTPVRCRVAGQAGGRDYVLCECGKHAFDGGDCPYCGVPVVGFVPDSDIVIDTVKKFLQSGTVRIDHNDAVDA